jgi:hypothetical protein
MPAKLFSFGVAKRRLISKILLLCSLGAALLLAACAGTSNAGSVSSGLGAIATASAGTADNQGFVLADVITPAAPVTSTGTFRSDTAAAPLFGGEITAIVPAAGESVWQVGDRAIHVTSDTVLNTSAGPVQVGAHVTIGGVARSDGSIDAAWVRVDDTGPGAGPIMPGQAPVTVTGTATTTGSLATAAPTQGAAAQGAAAQGAGEDSQAQAVYCGLIEQLPQSGIVGDWRVSNRSVHVGQATRVQAQGNRFDLGWFAFIRGAVRSDGSIDARQIWVRPPGNDRCLPGLRVGQNDGAGDGNGNGAFGNPGNGNGNVNNGRGNGNGNGRGNGSGNGNGPKPGKGNGR